MGCIASRGRTYSGPHRQFAWAVWRRRWRAWLSARVLLALLAALALSLPSATLAQGFKGKSKTSPGNDSDVKIGSLNTGTVGQREGGPDGGTSEWIDWLLERREVREGIAGLAGPAMREMLEDERRRFEAVIEDVGPGQERQLETDRHLAETSDTMRRTLREFGELGGRRADLPDTGFD